MSAASQWQDYVPAKKQSEAGGWQDYAPVKGEAATTASQKTTAAAPDRFAQDRAITDAWAQNHSILGPVARFLVAGGQNAANAITKTPGQVYHAFTDPTTIEETGLSPEQKLLYRMGGKQAIEAAEDYASGKVTPKAAVSVLPEALGTGLGQVSGGAIYGKGGDIGREVVPEAIDTVASPTKMTAPVRAAIRGANTVLKRAPASVGTSLGAGLGAVTRIPGMAELGGGLGYAMGKEFLPKLEIPGEHFGLPARVEGGPAIAPGYTIYPGAPFPEHPGVFPGAALPASPTPELLQSRGLATGGTTATPSAAAALQRIPTAKTAIPEPTSEITGAVRTPGSESIPRTLSGESALRRILAGQDTQNLLKIARARGLGVSQESNLVPKIAGPRLINKILDDFSPGELQDIQDQYLENTRMGRHEFGEIGPEAWKTMALRSYFPDVKIPQAALNRTASAITKAGPEETTLTPTPQEDLMGALQESVKQARGKKKPQ